MKVDDLIDKYINANQDEELKGWSSEYVIPDIEVIETNNQKDNSLDYDNSLVSSWLELRERRFYNLRLDDLDLIRKMLKESTGQGTGYSVKKYHHAGSYASGFNVWVPSAWKINTFWTDKLWQGAPVTIFGDNGVPKVVQMRDSSWVWGVIQLQYWDADAWFYWAEAFLNALPWINRLDEFIEEGSLQLWKMFPNTVYWGTVPNEVLAANWSLVKSKLDSFFGYYGDDREPENFNDYDPILSQEFETDPVDPGDDYDHITYFPKPPLP